MFYAFLKKNEVLNDFIYNYSAWQKNRLNNKNETLDNFIIRKIITHKAKNLILEAFHWPNDKWAKLNRLWEGELNKKEIFFHKVFKKK